MKINESPTWVPVTQLSRADKVEGGRMGAANTQARELAWRTKYLLELVKAIPDYREYTFYTTESDPDGTIQGVASTKEGRRFVSGSVNAWAFVIIFITKVQQFLLVRV